MTRGERIYFSKSKLRKNAFQPNAFIEDEPIGIMLDGAVIFTCHEDFALTVHINPH